MRVLRLLPLAALVSACTVGDPYVRPTPPIPAVWPGASTLDLPSATAPGDWRSIIVTPPLRALVQRALQDNRDLRGRLAAVAQANAQYGVQRSAQRPSFTIGAQAQVTPVGADVVYGANYYQAGLGLSDFDIDLFGRLRNLSRAAFEQYLTTDAGFREARTVLVSAVGQAAVALAADRRLLAIAKDEAASGEHALRVTRSLVVAGLAPRSDLDDAETIAAQARSDLEDQTTRVAQDRDALALLVGGPVSDGELAFDLDSLAAGVERPAAGLSSTMLLDRPDVRAAEHQLKAANFQVGAARAAFFPTFTLTSTVGLASTALGAFVTGGTAGVSVLPTLAAPLLGGPQRALLASARAQRSGAVDAYEGVVQSAFRDVADDLARLDTVSRQQAAQTTLVSAADRSWRLAEVRYKAGAETFLSTLVAQRTLYAARRSSVSVAVADLNARLQLLQHLGIGA